MKKGIIFLAGMVTTVAVQKLWGLADKKFGISEKVSKKVAELRGQAGEKKEDDNFENPQ